MKFRKIDGDLINLDQVFFITSDEDEKSSSLIVFPDRVLKVEASMDEIIRIMHDDRQLYEEEI